MSGIYIGAKPVLNLSDVDSLDSVVVIDGSVADVRLVPYSQWSASYAKLSVDQSWTGTQSFVSVVVTAATFLGDINVTGVVSASSCSITEGVFTHISRSFNDAISAAGTSQGTATALTYYEVVQVTSASGSADGVLLVAGSAAGRTFSIANESGQAIKVYPPSGAAIDDLGTNNYYALADNAHKQFTSVSATKWLSF